VYQTRSTSHHLVGEGRPLARSPLLADVHGCLVIGKVKPFSSQAQAKLYLSHLRTSSSSSTPFVFGEHCIIKVQHEFATLALERAVDAVLKSRGEKGNAKKTGSPSVA